MAIQRLSTDDHDDMVQDIADLRAMIRKIEKSEWMVTHDWGGDRDALWREARSLVRRTGGRKKIHRPG